jgi:methyltransferase
MNPAADPGPVPVAALVLFLVALLGQRSFELAISGLNQRRLLAHGAREHGRGHYPLVVALHAVFPLALIAEVVLLGARPGAWAPLWLALWLAAQWLRHASMRALGLRWTTRVLVLPGEPPVRRGIYRWLRHPNYLAVVIEFLAAPLMFGAWRTALACSLANLILLGVRIRCEERALAGAAIPHPDP